MGCRHYFLQRAACRSIQTLEDVLSVRVVLDLLDEFTNTRIVQLVSQLNVGNPDILKSMSTSLNVEGEVDVDWFSAHNGSPRSIVISIFF